MFVTNVYNSWKFDDRKIEIGVILHLVLYFLKTVRNILRNSLAPCQKISKITSGISFSYPFSPFFLWLTTIILLFHLRIQLLNFLTNIQKKKSLRDSRFKCFNPSCDECLVIIIIRCRYSIYCTEFFSHRSLLITYND